MSLYPEIEPYAVQHLAVAGGHELYIEVSGNPQGIPAVFLHGGPGAGCDDVHRRFFDPEKYRIVLFDQRGAGRSKPYACLENNTTQDLIADMEQIRQALGIKAWLVVGGSWGSTFGLAYAQAHPEHVLGLVLRGIFLCRDEDIHWFYQHGCSRLFPDYWQDFIAPIPLHARDNLVMAYHDALLSDDEATRLAAAKAWALWEGRTLTLCPDEYVLDFFSAPEVFVSLAQIECHYFMHHAFLRKNQLLNEAWKLKDIPGVIVHGRYDVICPVDQAYALHEVWPKSELNIVPDAGHALTEPGISIATIKAIDDFAERLA